MITKIEGMQDWIDYWDDEFSVIEDEELMREAYEDFKRREAESEALGYL